MFGVHAMHASEAKVKTAIEACRSLLTEEEYREVSEENEQHGEWGLAIENLADWLGEKEAKINRTQFKLIEDAFASMKLDPDGRTEYLRQFII